MFLLILAGLAIAALLAALALMWRRLEDMALEVRRLRARLRLAGLEEAEPSPSQQEELFAPLPPPRPRALPRALRERAATPETLLRRAGRATLALCVAAAPALEILVRAPLAAVLAAGLLFCLALLALSRLERWRDIAWIAAIGASAWTLWATVLQAQPSDGAALAGIIVLAGLAVMIHAWVHGDFGAPALLLVGLAAGAFALASREPMADWGLAALGVLVAGGAIVGAARTRLEAFHFGAWLGACGGLYLLSGQTARADLWFAPASAWAGALFLGIAVVRAPLLGRQGLVVAATGAVTPILAASTAHAVVEGAPAWTAIVFAIIALCLGAVLGVSAERNGGVARLGPAAAPLGVGAIIAAIAAIFLAAPSPIAAGALALMSLALIALDWRFPNLMWRLLALCVGICAIALIGADLLEPSNEAGRSDLSFIAAALALPTLAWAGAAFIASRTTFVTSRLFEAAAVASAALTFFFSVRWIASAGAPQAAPYGFAEMGTHASVWLGFALALIWIGAEDTLRRAGAALFAGGAIAALALGPMGALNPLWGAWRTPVEGAPIVNDLALGFGLPAALAALFAAYFWRAREMWAMWAAIAGATLLALTWASLEVRRSFHGPALEAGPTSAAEALTILTLIALTVLGLAFGAHRLTPFPAPGARRRTGPAMDLATAARQSAPRRRMRAILQDRAK